MNEQTITFTLSVQEANSVLQALGQMPFAQVVELIDKLRKQGSEQVSAQLPADPAKA